MNFNPYEAPRSPELAQNSPPVPSGEPQPWEMGEVLSIGWKNIKMHWRVLVFASFVAWLVDVGLGFVPALLVATHAVSQSSAEYTIISRCGSLVGFVVGMFFSAGQVKIYVAAARGQAPRFADIFSGARFLPLLGAEAVMCLGIICGALLLVVPGVILGLGWSLMHFYVVDAQMSPLVALEASWQTTKGQRGQLLSLSVVSLPVFLAAILVCCVGILRGSDAQMGPLEVLNPIGVLMASWQVTMGQNGQFFGLDLVRVLVLLTGMLTYGVGILVAQPITSAAFATVYLRRSGRG